MEAAPGQPLSEPFEDLRDAVAHRPSGGGGIDCDVERGSDPLRHLRQWAGRVGCKLGTGVDRRPWIIPCIPSGFRCCGSKNWMQNRRRDLGNGCEQNEACVTSMFSFRIINRTTSENTDRLHKKKTVHPLQKKIGCNDWSVVYSIHVS